MISARHSLLNAPISPTSPHHIERGIINFHCSKFYCDGQVILGTNQSECWNSGHVQVKVQQQTPDFPEWLYN
jgi:hypothetical protein